MFPSKFLQFPSILTHFHAANEKIQNGGRDLAISRGLVWVKCHAIIWPNVDLISIEPLETNFNKIWIKMEHFAAIGGNFVSASMC